MVGGTMLAEVLAWPTFIDFFAFGIVVELHGILLSCLPALLFECTATVLPTCNVCLTQS